MIIAQHPSNEAARLAAVRASGLLDSEPELGFDNLTRHAAHIARTPTALVSIVGEDRQWLKSRFGFAGEETSRDVAFCAHAILDDQPLVVEDAMLDERFCENPLVLGNPNIRFYAGFPFKGAEGSAFGTLCVIDVEPRTLDADQMEFIGMLAKQVEAQVELRTAIAALDNFTEGKEALLRALNQEAKVTYEGVMSAHRHLAHSALDAEQQAYLGFSVDATHHLVVVLEDIARRLGS